MLLDFDITTEPCRLLLGIAYDRLYKFFMRYDSAATQPHSHLLVQQLLKRLIDHDDKLKLYLSMDNGHAVGHFLLSIETPDTAPSFIYVHQLEYDDHHMGKAFIVEALTLIDSLAEQYTCDRIMMTTARQPQVFRQFGFEVFRTIMVRPCGVDTPGQSTPVPGTNGQLAGLTPALLQQLQALLQQTATQQHTAVHDLDMQHGPETHNDDDMW